MEIIGLLAFFLIAATAINGILSAIEQPVVQNAVRDAAPFLGDHLTALTLTAGAILALIVVAIPPVIKRRESASAGPGAFEYLGMGVACVLGMISVGYLVGIGVVAATHVLQ